MREIKFKGKCAFSGAWRYGYYYPSKGNHIIRDDEDKETIVLPKTVGQYTGLKDRNDVEIYEGDVVSHAIETRLTSKTTMTGMDVVKWDGFEAKFVIGECDLIFKCYDIHGNIHDNPELL